ncbi:MAG: LysE family transporter [Duncaniella sp.]|nr:LysE family transporter [Duncaniella sp.]MDE6327854.1 LysE family transporter [Duncaniella sp.]MDE6572581.1 LysE family transporter [Duncaniella sp.]MDE6765569.1 LysE family transporter [Duncaniella sp.]
MLIKLILTSRGFSLILYSVIHIPVIMYRGILIGILVSAPMGPIGMLCIQRTLSRGRWPAFFTGVGAGVSDFTYCLLAGLGLSFVTDFIQTNQSLLQLLGSVVLLVYAGYLFGSNPSRSIGKTALQSMSYWKDFVTGFFFTVSNPLILFLIIGLFARFSFLAPEFEAYHYVVGYLSIFAGAVLWWFGVTWFVNKVRGHFNLRSMWLVNRVLAAIIVVMGAIGFLTALRDLIMR